jgi:RNA polymerase sigma factor (sigma-70 family)
LLQPEVRPLEIDAAEPGASSPTIRSLTDEQCRWLASLYESNFASVFKACRSILKSTDDAADAAHEVFLRAVQAAPRNALAIDSRAWLVAVARNYCCDLLRRRERLGRALTTLAAGSNHPAEVEGAVVDRQVLDGILVQLRPRERQVLWQSAVEHRPLAEIARHLGLSYVAAAQLLHRARKRAWLAAARLAGIIALWRGRRQPSGNVSGAGSGLIVASVLPVLLATMASSAAVHRSGPITSTHPAEIRPASLPTSVTSGIASPGSHLLGAVQPAARVPDLAGLPALSVPPGVGSTMDPLVRTAQDAVRQIAGHTLSEPTAGLLEGRLP